MKRTEDKIVAASMGYFDAVEGIIVRRRYDVGESRDQVATHMTTKFARAVFAMVWPEEPKK